jgi:putative lipoic acid-binding regulatory protein
MISIQVSSLLAILLSMATLFSSFSRGCGYLQHARLPHRAALRVYGVNKPPDLFKENGGVPKIPSVDQLPMPSIDQLAKQQQLITKIQDGGTGGIKKTLDATLKFPCEFILKIIGQNDATFVDDIITLLATRINQDPKDLKYTTTTKGKYLSISVSPVFKNSSEVESAYEVLKEDTRVKFVL